MKRKPSTAPVVDSPWATSILPSTSKRPLTEDFRAPAGVPDAPPPAPASAPLPVPASFATPAWSPPAVAISQSSFDSAPPLGAERQFGAEAFGVSSQYGPPAQFAPPPQYAPPPPPTNSPSGYQPNHFEPQGYAAPGYQAQGYAPPGYAPPGYAPPGQALPYQNVPPTSGRSTGAKVLIGLAIGVVGFIVLGILAAIAIPVFLSQRAKTANRNVVLPGILLEQPQLHSTSLDTVMSDAVGQLQTSITGVTETQGAYYGPGDQPLFAVVAGRLPTRPTAADENSFFTAIAADDHVTGGFHPTGSGPYGGKMECGQTLVPGEAPVTFCASVDSAAVVLIIGFNQSTNQTGILARQIIGSIEPARP